MKKIIEEINTILQENLILYPSETLLCTVSSGQDSLLLFLVFLHLKTQWKLSLVLIYCHHFWQKTNFFSFWHIWKIAFIFKLPYFFLVTETKLSTENKARNWRQKSVERMALLQNSNQIAFGHTGSDKIETALWHLIRGSSPTGLNCIKQQILSKTTFLHIFFVVEQTKAFKGRNNQFKTKKKFFSIKPSKEISILFFTNSTSLHNHCHSQTESKQGLELCGTRNFQFFGIKMNRLSQKKLIKGSLVFFILLEQKFIKKKFLSFWSAPKRCFQVYETRNLVNVKSSGFYSFNENPSPWFISQDKPNQNYRNLCELNQNISQVEQSDNFFQKLNLENQTNYLIFSDSENLKFFSFCLKNSSEKVVLKKLRPLINFHREDILKFTEHYFLPVIPDSTNALSNLSRSKIRNQLIPIIRYLFHSKFDSAFSHFLKILENEYLDLDQAVQKLYQTLFKTLFFSNSIITESQKKKFFSSNATKKKISKRQMKKNQQLCYFTKEISLALNVRYQFQKLPISLQSKLLKKIFFNYTSSQLKYSQQETLRFLILDKKSSSKKERKKVRRTYLKIFKNYFKFPTKKLRSWIKTLSKQGCPKGNDLFLSLPI